MKKILVLEDEASIRSFIVINLRRAGYDVIEAESGEEALERLRANPDVKVALLDIMLPGIDGFEVCRRIRATNTKIGIIMLTARSQEMDKVTGLMTGADDYVTKPFNILEVKARIKAIMRRNSKKSAKAKEAENKMVTAGDLKLDREGRRVFIGEKEINLTAKEFDLLELLVCNPNKVYSRESLLTFVWGNKASESGDVRTVDVHVRRLREKIEPSPSDPKYVHTKWGVGYYFRA